MSPRKVRALVVQSSGSADVVPSPKRSDALDAGAVASALRAAGMKGVAESASSEEAFEAATRQRAYVILFDVHDVPRQSTAEAPSSTEPLTDREQEILTVLAGGHSYADVACALGIAIDTVRSHVRSIYRKLNVCCKTEAVVVALNEGALFGGARSRDQAVRFFPCEEVEAAFGTLHFRKASKARQDFPLPRRDEHPA